MILCLWRNHQTTKYGKSFAWQIINGIFILLFFWCRWSKNRVVLIWTHSYNISIILASKLNCTQTWHTHTSLKSKHWRNIITFPCEVKVLNFECNVYFVRIEPNDWCSHYPLVWICCFCSHFVKIKQNHIWACWVDEHTICYMNSSRILIYFCYMLVAEKRRRNTVRF